MKYLSLLFLIVPLLLGCDLPKNSTPITQSSPTPSATEQPKTFTNLFELAAKSPEQIEAKIGKPKTAKKVTDSDLFDNEREYAVANFPDSYLLLVRFQRGKSAQFIQSVPIDSGNTDPKKFVESFGFDVSNLESEKFPEITNWKGRISGVDFEKIAAMKMFGDRYSNITVILTQR